MAESSEGIQFDDLTPREAEAYLDSAIYSHLAAISAAERFNSVQKVVEEVGKHWEFAKEQFEHCSKEQEA